MLSSFRVSYILIVGLTSLQSLFQIIQNYLKSWV